MPGPAGPAPVVAGPSTAPLATAGPPGPPGGISPDMAKMATDMMANMKPEDMARFQDMARSMGTGGGAAGGGAGGGLSGMDPSMMANMEKHMADPKMLDSMFGMLQGMDKDTLVRAVTFFRFEILTLLLDADCLNFFLLYFCLTLIALHL